MRNVRQEEMLGVEETAYTEAGVKEWMGRRRERRDDIQHGRRRAVVRGEMREVRWQNMAAELRDGEEGNSVAEETGTTEQA